LKRVKRKSMSKRERSREETQNRRASAEKTKRSSKLMSELSL